MEVPISVLVFLATVLLLEDTSLVSIKLLLIATSEFPGTNVEKLSNVKIDQLLLVLEGDKLFKNMKEDVYLPSGELNKISEENNFEIISVSILVTSSEMSIMSILLELSSS